MIQNLHLIYDKDKNFDVLNYISPKCFSNNDTFKMIFCFNDNKWIIYHNKQYAQTLSLKNCKKLTVAFSLSKLMEIQIIKCQFQYNKSL